MTVEEMDVWLGAYVPSPDYRDDGYMLLACREALKGVKEGNFGVGCVLVDRAGHVVECGHNEMFRPHFRSNRHAEMVVMDRVEAQEMRSGFFVGYTLYTSLESCPMCLARLINAGVSRVLHAAPDLNGGMVHRMEGMPPIWRTMAEHQTFAQADCSPALLKAAEMIMGLNMDELNAKLKREG